MEPLWQEVRMKKVFKNWKMPEAVDIPLNYEESALTGEYDFHLKGCHLRILDIGANIGMYALWALKKYPYSKIYSYEPMPETFKYLERNTKWCRFAVEVNNKAVSIQPSLTVKYDRRYSHLAGSGGIGKEVIVEGVHPKDLPEVDLVKIDVEGEEFNIVRNLNLRTVKVIVMEIHSEEQINAIQDYLFECGFVIRSIRAPLYNIGLGIFAFQQRDLGDKFIEDVVDLKEML